MQFIFLIYLLVEIVRQFHELKFVALISHGQNGVE